MFSFNNYVSLRYPRTQLKFGNRIVICLGKGYQLYLPSVLSLTFQLYVSVFPLVLGWGLDLDLILSVSEFRC